MITNFILTAIIVVYLVLGCMICKEYVEIQNSKQHHKRIVKENILSRILFRLSIILFYPIYMLGFIVLYLIELLTEKEPFK